MSLLTNKHVIVALIVTPILAIIAFFATDMIVSEKPQAAQSGENYPLAANPNCRYTSGACTLKNGNFSITLTSDKEQGQLTLQASHPLQGVKIAVDTDEPQDLQDTDGQAVSWTMPLAGQFTENNKLQLVAKASEALYFAEVSMVFVEYKTLIDKPL